MVQNYSINIINAISRQVFNEAARLKASYKCSLADSLGIATALEMSGQFVTSDHSELEAIANKEGLNFCWFR